MSQQTEPATSKQLAYLRDLANQTGTTFTSPRSRREASREIRRLREHKTKHGIYRERRPADDTASSATSPDTPENNGWGSAEGPRATRPHRSDKPGTEAGGETSPPALAGKPLGNYQPVDGGDARQLIGVPVGEATLVIDHLRGSDDDTRVVGRIEPDEPARNAQLLVDLYLADPNRGCCRRLTPADLTGHTKPEAAQAEEVVRWQAPLIAGVGEVFRLLVLDEGYPVLRWVRQQPADDPSRVPVSLRCVVAELQDYEPAIAMTRTAIREHEQQDCSIVLVRGELQRLMSSAIVLNRRLREHVERTVKAGGVSMSEIAIRCGRVKKDRRGRESGDTSWVARRIGQLPESGRSRPNPWVHSEVLARIARDGLGITPQEAEV